MNRNIKLKIFTAILFSFISETVFSQDLIKQVTEVKTAEGFKHSSWGVYAEYADNGEVILNSDGHLSLAPASNLKLFTSAAALHFLGEDYRFTTSLYITGNVDKNGVLNGDIIIRGGGDPTLGSIQVKGSLPLDTLMRRWSDAFVSLGIKKINGSVMADELLFDKDALPDYFPWIDMGNYYGASTSALSIHDNLYYLYFQPGEKTGDPAGVLRTYPDGTGLSFINYMKTGSPGSGDNGYIYAAPKSTTAVLRGTVPAGTDEFSIKGSLPDPAFFAASCLTDFLKLKGIEINNPPKLVENYIDYNNLTNVVNTLSPPVKDIVFIINKKSFNLYADQLFKMIAVKEFSEGSFDKGADAVVKFLTEVGVSPDGIRLFDGSGLSRNNFITPEVMCKMLSAITRQNYFESFYNSLGVAGDPADISAFRSWGVNTILANNLHIKSGTVNGVHGHSGYIKGKSGRLISFSFIANNYTGSNRQVNETHIKWLKVLAEKY